MSALGESAREPIETAEPVDAGPSLQQRIAQREREHEQAPEHTIILPVPGFEDILAVQYRALSVREMFAIETRVTKTIKDEYEQNLFGAADKLINACERIVEPTSDPDTFNDTGYQWGTKAARELFNRTLPEPSTARQALLSIFREEESLFAHFTAYEEQRAAVRKRLDSDLAGESAASSATS